MIGMMIVPETETRVGTATVQHAGEMTATVKGTKEEEEIATGAIATEATEIATATVHQGEETTATVTATVPHDATTALPAATATDPLVVTAPTGPRKKRKTTNPLPLPLLQQEEEEERK